MVIKRYTPRYKLLSRFKQPVWLEKRSKVKKFNRRKWEILKKVYFPKKWKFFNQDSSCLPVKPGFEGDRSIRLKKTYKFLLQDKQRFQFYYGGGRLRRFQLKNMAREACRISANKNLCSGKILLNILESRLDVALYRLGLASSLMQARRLINSGFIRIGENKNLKSPKRFLKIKDKLILDPAFFSTMLGRYLKRKAPFFYFRNRKIRKEIIFDREDCFNQSFLERNSLPFLKALRFQLISLKNLQKNKLKNV
jgi:ribosomal protein S4